MSYIQNSDGIILDDSGKVAIQYVISENGKRVIFEETGHDYTFAPQHHVCLAFVSPEDVSRLLGIREKSCNCNNGTYKNAFQYATLTNVNIWYTGNQ